MAKDEIHWTGKIAQKAIIEKDGKVLVQRSPLHERWDLPGGRLNVGELPEEGLKREVREELGVAIAIERIVTMFPFVIEGLGDHMFIVYAAQLEDPSQEFVLEPEEVAETKWISMSELDAFPVWNALRPALEIFFKMSDK